MRKQITHDWTLPLLTLGVALSLAAPSYAQRGVGKQYNARDPRPCAEAPSTSKVPTVAEVVDSVICNTEHEAGIETLFLVDDVKVVQIGKATPYKPGVDIGVSDIDLDFGIYPIRGSFKRYQCTLSSGKTPEKSCLLYDHQNATGRCYKDGFGHWRCSMNDNSVRDSVKVFPPGGARAAAAAPVAPTLGLPRDRPTAPMNQGPPAEKAAQKDENGFPQPDFGEMGKYFQVLKSDYDFRLGRFNLLVKATRRTNIFQWYLTFFDADGVKVKESSFNGALGEPELGVPTKIYSYTPTEREMAQVTRIAITRKIE